MGGQTLSTFLHSSWGEGGGVELIFLPDLAGDVIQLMEQSLSPCMLSITPFICAMGSNSGHSITLNVWRRIGEKHLAPSCKAHGKRACPADSFTTSD